MPKENAVHFYESSAIINASPAAVWAVLADAPSYPDWDSGIESVEGVIAPGETITVHASVNPGRAFPVKVADWEPDCCMTWTGGMPLGMFTGVRTFRLTPNDDGTTTFDMREEYHGPMVAVIWKSMPDLQPSFDQFALGLKARVESAGSAVD